MLPIARLRVYGFAIMSDVAKQRLLIALFAVIAIAMLVVPRIPQDPAYHEFADQRAWLGIPNAWNVLSSVVFAWVGLAGLYRLLRQKSLRTRSGFCSAYVIFFAALVLVALGSAYYHWNPTNASLALDRLSMALAFMAFSAILLGERVSPKFARRALLPLLLAAIAGVAYWHYSELAGRGDLRAYLLLQLMPIILLPFVLLAFDSDYDRNADLWWLLAWYLAAKLCELFDRQIFDVLGMVSGHSLKHIAAGIGGFMLLRHLRLRKPAA